MNVVQQTNSSSIFARGVNKSTATGTGSFTHDTKLGSLLLCAVQLQIVASQAGSYPPVVNPTSFAVTTPGFTWTLISSEICPTSFEYISGNHNVGTVAVALYAILNAPVMSSSAVISVTGNASASAASVLVTGILQEVSGPTALNFVVNPNYGSGSTVPSVGNIVETNTNDYLMTAECDEQVALTGFGSQWAKKESEGGWYLSYVLNTTPQTYTPAYTAVDTPGVWAAIAAAFSSPSPTPTITSVSPNNGPSSGGQLVTITGTNLTSPATVTFGGNLATSVNVVSSTEVTCVTPVGFPGTVDVQVTETAGIATLSKGYTYTASKIPISYNYQDAAGHPLSYGTVTFTLNTDAVTITGQQINAGVVTSFTLDVNGNLSGFLWPSDQMTSDGLSPNTTYRVKAYTAEGQLCFEQDRVILTP